MGLWLIPAVAQGAVISSFTAGSGIIDSFTVPLNTDIDGSTLPSTMEVTFSDATVGDIDVTWDVSSYNGSVAGTYNITPIIPAEHTYGGTLPYYRATVSSSTETRWTNLFMKYNLNGRFNITTAGGANFVEGVGRLRYIGSFVNEDNLGTTNASKSTLTQKYEDSTIAKAYLVMTSYTGSALTNVTMTLRGPSGSEITCTGTPEAGYDLVTKSGAVIISGITDTDIQEFGNCVSVTDVTEFVQQEGYGEYAGIDILPYDHSTTGANDKSLAWLLIVIEESPDIPIRYGFLQFGMISHADNTLIFDLPEGFSTTSTTTGQFIIMGSDDINTSPTLAAIENSDIGIYIYSDATDDSSGYYLQTYSRSMGILTRTNNKWSASLVDEDGEPREDWRHSAGNYGYGMDYSLVTVYPTEDSSWKTNRGHNMWIEAGSSTIKIETKKVGTYSAFLDVIGFLAGVDLDFETEINYAPASDPSDTGGEIHLGEEVIVFGKATNTSSDTETFTANTCVVIEVDPQLTDISDMTATFYDYDENTGTTTQITVTGVYNAANHTITFDFGSSGGYYPLLNGKNDELSFSFHATTLSETEGTTTYRNSAHVEYENMVSNNAPVETEAASVGESYHTFSVAEDAILPATPTPAPTVESAPQTGDGNHSVLYMILVITAALGVAVCVMIRQYQAVK